MPSPRKTRSLLRCPNCWKKSLFWNSSSGSYECLNLRCKHTYSPSSLETTLSAGHSHYRIPAIWIRTIGRKSARLIKSIFRVPRGILRSRLFLIIIGLAIIFSTIAYYPVLLQQWHFGFLDLVIWAEIPIQVFGGCLVLIGLFIGRRRSRTRAIKIILAIVVVVAGASYIYNSLQKSGKIDEWISRNSGTDTISGNIKEAIPSIAQTLEGLRLVEDNSNTPGNATTIASNEPIVSVANDTSRVWINGAYLVGGDWEPIKLVNNDDAINPTWDELVAFLRQDNTDRQRYDIHGFVCADFAEMLHNNAEAAGWRAAFVAVQLTGYKDFANLGIPPDVGHALNAFETTDRGIVYIDATNSATSTGMSADKIVHLEEGSEYIPESIFPEPGWSSKWESMGTVKRIETVQW